MRYVELVSFYEPFFFQGFGSYTCSSIPKVFQKYSRNLVFSLSLSLSELCKIQTSTSSSRNDLGCSHPVKGRGVALDRVDGLVEPRRARLAEIVLPVKVEPVHDEGQEGPAVRLEPPGLESMLCDHAVPNALVLPGKLIKRLVSSSSSIVVVVGHRAVTD
jgi:hypothetical protein